MSLFSSLKIVFKFLVYHWTTGIIISVLIIPRHQCTLHHCSALDIYCIPQQLKLTALHYFPECSSHLYKLQFNFTWIDHHLFWYAVFSMFKICIWSLPNYIIPTKKKNPFFEKGLRYHEKSIKVIEVMINKKCLK